MDAGEDIGLGEVLAILLAVGVGVYFLYSFVSNYFKSATCLAKVGTIPGVTGATKQQACAPKIANDTLKPGGSTIWSASGCCSDYDYAQPCGNVVQVRHSFWGQLWGTPVTYTTVPRDCYVRPAGGTVNPAFACCYGCAPASAAGFPPCCGGKQMPVGGGGGGGF
jgi:hypothetical protein